MATGSFAGVAFEVFDSPRTLRQTANATIHRIPSSDTAQFTDRAGVNAPVKAIQVYIAQSAVETLFAKLNQVGKLVITADYPSPGKNARLESLEDSGEDEWQGGVRMARLNAQFMVLG